MNDTIKIDNRGDFGLWAIEMAKQIVGDQGFELARAARDGTDDDVRQAGNALGQAITSAGETGIETIVAVRHPPPEEKDRPIAVVSPCGACRELIWDYDRNARVIVPGRDSPETVGISELIPNKYSRERGT